MIIIEETETGFSAYSPEIDGCIATGKTISETEQNMKEAIEFHIEGMILEGLEVPNSSIINTMYYELETA